MRQINKHITLIILTITYGLFWLNPLFSQCDITATGNGSTSDTVYICQGDHINLQSQGDCDVYLMQNDFNSGTIGSGWSSNASPMFNNPCGPGPDGSTCLWIGPATNFPRQLVTVPFSVNNSCTICFDMIYSVQGVPSPCEGPDLPQEGVHLQWSNDGGATWTDIDYWAPNGGYDPTLTNWANYCSNVPVAGTNIQFRWFQTNTSGNNYDHWGIDNVVITCPSPPVNIVWTGPGGFTYNNYNPPSFQPNQSGWYTVTISDGIYSSADSVYVLISSPISVTLTPANPTLCYGQTSTLISSQVTGGYPPYTYTWSNGATTPNISVGVGTYSLIVSDISGCFSASANVTVTANSAPITANAGTDQTLCITSTSVSLNGSVTVASGGIWSGGNGIFVPSNLNLNATYIPTSAEISGGSVTLTLTSTGNGSCPAVSDDIVIQFVGFQSGLTINTVPINCFNGNNGSATAVVTGGNPPFSYLWNTTPPQTSPTAINLSAGNYIVTVTDGIGCTGTSSVSLGNPSELTALITSQSVSCYGATNGYATVNVFGGTPGYSYMWSNGANGVTVAGLSSGNYTVTVTDAMGCSVVVITTVTSPDLLSASIITYSNIDCAGGNNGTATVNVTGGTPGYSYLWSSNAGNSAIAVGLTANTYTVSVTDANGCQTTAQITLTQPSALTLNIGSTDVSCFGGSDGTASASVTGGTPPYMYVWSPYGGTFTTANGLIAGIFTITVTDSRACQIAGSAIIDQPSPLLVTGNVQNVKCFGGSTGSANLAVTGGTAPYTYNWSPNVSTTSTATGLTSGNYFVTVLDANGCSFNINLFVDQPITPLSVDLTVTNIGCYGSQNGAVTANASGGTTPYQYFWQPTGSTSPSISNLPAGNYFVTVTDANLCTELESATVAQPGGITLAVSIIEANCNTSTGQATITPSGGTPPYSYYWMPGGATASFINAVPSGIYAVTVTDNSGCTYSGLITIDDISGPQVSVTSIQNASCFGVLDGSASVTVTGGTPAYTYSWFPYGGNNDTATGLGAGTYSIVVSDALGCQGFAVTNPAISQPPAISVTSSQINVSCFGASNASTNLTVTGGTPPYTYIWSPNGLTFPNPTGLAQGTYYVTVTDFNNCTEEYFVDISEPAALSANISSSQNINCFGGHNGSATVNVTGGTPPYTYLWSPSSSTSQTATGLSSGTHTVYVTDSKGCSISASIFLSQPASMSYFTGCIQPNCHNGSDGTAWVIVSGGVPPYSYSWSPAGGTNDTAWSLNAGIYYSIITDSRSCQTVAPVYINQPSPVSVSITNYSDITCFGSNNGYAIASVSGGTPGYTYLWSNGVTFPANTGLSSSVYSVTVTDTHSCTGTASLTIQEPLDALAVTIQSQNISCYGGNDGSAAAIVSGGTPPYTYIWIPAVQFTPTATNLCSGTYTVSVTDINGCQASGTVTLSQPQSLELNTTVTQPVTCFGTNTGKATVVVSGGAPPYSFVWNTVPIQNSQDASNIFAGSYSVTVTDDYGCTAVDSIIVPEPPVLEAVIISQVNVSCFNGSNGIVIAGAQGGTPPYLYTWNTVPVSYGPTVTDISSGLYTVSVTDYNGCLDTITININSPSQVITNINPDEIICQGESVTLTATASGGTSPYQFHWNSGLGFGNDMIVTPLNTTDYIVNAYDANGCTGSPDTVIVHVLTLYPQDVTVNSFSPICPGNTSQISVSAQCSLFDNLTYSWNNGLGPGPGPFIVVPTQETYYTVTVTNSCGFSVVDSAGVFFANPPTVQFIADTNQGCRPVTISFTDYSYTTFDDINEWLWNFGDGTTSTEQNPVHTYSVAGTYFVWLTVTTTGGCTNSSESNPMSVYIFHNPVASFSVNSTTVYLPNQPVVCTNTSSGGTSYLWDFGDGGSSVQKNPQHMYTDLGDYTIILTVSNTNACSDTFSLKIKATSDIEFPNVFTPDPDFSSGGNYDINDYSNHVFFPYTAGIEDFHMMIFNRWGELIFETHDILVGWDGYYKGKLCQQDVYVYKATALFYDGRRVEKVGDVLLLR